MIPAATIPSEACYWARLPASPRRWTRQRIIAGIEPQIPSDADRLDLAWAPAHDGGLVVVAIEPQLLDDLLAKLPPAWTAIPDRIPELLADAGVEAAALNLLTGVRTPARLRRGRNLLALAALATAVLITVLLVIGTWRRIAAIHTETAAIATAGETALAAAIPPALGGNDSDPLIRLDQARRLADSLRTAAGGTGDPASVVLTRILAAWPPDVRAQVGNLSADGNRLTVSGRAATVEDAQRLANALATALASLPGWRAQPLQASSDGTATSFTCTAVREKP